MLWIFYALFSPLDVSNSGKTLSEGLMSHCDSFFFILYRKRLHGVFHRFDSHKLWIFYALFSFFHVSNSGKTLSEGLMSHCDCFILFFPESVYMAFFIALILICFGYFMHCFHFWTFVIMENSD